MTSAQASQKFGAELSLRTWTHVPGATTAMIVSPDGGTTLRYIDGSVFDHFGVLASNEVLVGNGIVKVEIVAADDAAFANNLTVIKDSGTIAMTTIDKQCFLECSAEEIAHASAQAGANLRYVAARLTLNNSGDKARVAYIARPRFAYLNLTNNGVT